MGRGGGVKHFIIFSREDIRVIFLDVILDVSFWSTTSTIAASKLPHFSTF